MSDWKLTKKEYDILLRYLGCGNIPNADILVFGNEEGTGGYSIEANVKARTNLFGRDKLNKKIIHTIPMNNGEINFFEPSSNGGRAKVEECLTKNEKIKEKGFTQGVFNPAIARICLALENKNSMDWFEAASCNPEAWNVIREYVINDLYETRQGIQTALVDWRPLPRENESDWKEVYSNISDTLKNEYLFYFNHPQTKRKLKRVEFSDFKTDMEYRGELIKSVFHESKAKIIVGIGGASGFKKQALEKMFGKNIFNPLTFETCSMHNKKGNLISAYQAHIKVDEKDMHIFLIPFPEAGTVFKTQDDALNMLKEFTYRHIKPILDHK